ncbi:MAG: glycosyltransferase family 2 protein [Thermoguttaceae bacterium]|jgi:dolichol-phosphate mannosyltransferase
MYQSRRIMGIVPAYNEEAKIGNVVKRSPRYVVDELLVVDDGSTDATAGVARTAGAEVLSFPQVRGVGAAIRAGLAAGRSRGFDVAVIMAGNDKDNPAEIPRLLDPICAEGMDLVVGSRYLAGGQYGGDMPKYRRLATRLHPWLLSRFVGKRLTESTNGFRAVRLKCLDDPRILLDQAWLDGYGLEVYLLYKMIKCGFHHTEVPCTKIYPPKKTGNTKMRPIVDWWDILKPIFLMGLGIKK